MTKYKGYVLSREESTSEEKEWSGGHKSEGTGRYVTSTWVKTFNIKTGNTENFKDEQEAKEAIDNRRENARHNKKLEIERKRLDAKKEKLKQRLEETKNLLGDLTREYNKLSEQKKKVP